MEGRLPQHGTSGLAPASSAHAQGPFPLHVDASGLKHYIWPQCPGYTGSQGVDTPMKLVRGDPQGLELRDGGCVNVQSVSPARIDLSSIDLSSKFFDPSRRWGDRWEPGLHTADVECVSDGDVDPAKAARIAPGLPPATTPENPQLSHPHASRGEEVAQPAAQGDSPPGQAPATLCISGIDREAWRKLRQELRVSETSPCTFSGMSGIETLAKKHMESFKRLLPSARLAPNREIRIGTVCSGSFADCVSVVAFMHAVRTEYPDFRVRYMFHCEKAAKRREWIMRVHKHFAADITADGTDTDVACMPCMFGDVAELHTGWAP